MNQTRNARMTAGRMVTALLGLAGLMAFCFGTVSHENAQGSEPQIKLPSGGGIKLPTGEKPKTGGGIKLPNKDDKKKPDDKTPNTGGGRLGGDVLVVPFMKLKAKGKNFVIIADRSGSMAAGKWYYDYATRTEKRGKIASIDYLKEELHKTIDACSKKNGRLYIFLYDSKTTHQPTPTYASGSKDLKIVKDWVNKIKPQGDTDPWPAFQRAFQLRPLPDAIFFMSDGIIPYNLVERVDSLQARIAEKQRPAIHTVQLFVPGQDPASVLMSRWANSKLLPPNIRGAIQNAKIQHMQRMANPFERQKLENDKRTQKWQMETLAKQYNGESRVIDKVGSN